MKNSKLYLPYGVKPDGYLYWSLLILLLFSSITSFATSPPRGPTLVPLHFPEASVISKNTIRVPFRLAGRLIAVQATVGDRKGIFIIDTGASRLILNSVHFPAGWKSSHSGMASMGTTGAVGEVKKKTVPDFQWDSLFFDNMLADVIDLSHIEQKKNIEILGLIGYETLKGFEILIDFRLRQITLMRLDEQGERLDSLAVLETPVDSLAFQMQSHFITLSGNVDEVPVRFGLDTGAELNLLHHRVNRKVLDHFKIAKRVNLNGTGQGSVEVLAGALYKFRCGNQHFSGMQTLLTNMREMNRSFRTSLDGLLGFEFLYNRRTIINYKKKMLYFLEWEKP